ncbi:MAG: hypothetical protein GAK35_03689 [Herbaspirillum frisingense]|uniref:Efflux RND transporter permease subunit n=1 Tax=Herbaspirillum frisingense TaxID=92645 RepID=A0A7V8JT15_9BURK|nr:MAG: hypothetical protein GAK35_03689 [Herbaspirillum frisingense]
MWFTRISIGNPVLATMMMMAFVVLGLFDLPPEYPYRSKLEVRLLLSAPKRARSSHETIEI